MTERSGGSVVDNTLDYQSRDRKIDPASPVFRMRLLYALVQTILQR